MRRCFCASSSPSPNGFLRLLPFLPAAPFTVRVNFTPDGSGEWAEGERPGDLRPPVRYTHPGSGGSVFQSRLHRRPSAMRPLMKSRRYASTLRSSSSVPAPANARSTYFLSAGGQFCEPPCPPCALALLDADGGGGGGGVRGGGGGEGVAAAAAALAAFADWKAPHAAGFCFCANVRVTPRCPGWLAWLATEAVGAGGAGGWADDDTGTYAGMGMPADFGLLAWVAFDSAGVGH
mmetsp:Transcript_32423/g.81235  ORF Transcript_32423/g.81235 Transcript_32423/m.81235 type:complete len:234 (+) Transcript_32423:877-1578(+)